MARLICDISISLDGFVAGPSPSLEEPLGKGASSCTKWAFAAQSWRESHGLEAASGTPTPKSSKNGFRATGAVVMGRKMFSGGEGGWEDDPRAPRLVGENPPFHVPVFVLTHHASRDARHGG